MLVSHVAGKGKGALTLLVRPFKVRFEPRKLLAVVEWATRSFTSSSQTQLGRLEKLGSFSLVLPLGYMSCSCTFCFQSLPG